MCPTLCDPIDVSPPGLLVPGILQARTLEWVAILVSIKNSHFSLKIKALKDGNNTPVYETAKETLMYRTVLWNLWERERVGRFGRMALKHVKYHV